MSAMMLRFVLQLGVIIIAARVGGIVLRRVFRLPGVLGELITGMLIGPYALGRLTVLGLGPLFPPPEAAMPVTPELYAIATLAAIILLFLSGLETDLSTFLRYSVIGTVVGVGGVAFAFAGGAWCACWFGVAHSFMDPAALFLGAISTATSVGITVRILSEKRRMDSPEGVTILAGAVFDDVLGIVLLAVVVGMSKVEKADGFVEWHHIGWITIKALGFWVVGTTLGLLLARRFSRLLKFLRSTENMASIAFGVALLLAGMSEMAGLAMIIGAYIVGLSLSRTDLVEVIRHELQGLQNTLVPVFFCVMGMLVDLRAVRGAVVFGLVYALVAILAKLLGCGLPAWLTKFNLRGALRVGIGMVPRGEVALIIAGIGLAAGAIPRDVFGVAIIMTAITTFLGPPLLAWSFERGEGLRPGAERDANHIRSFAIAFPTPEAADFICAHLAAAFRQEEFFVYRLSPDADVYQIRKEHYVISLVREAEEVRLSMPARAEPVARLIVLEALLELEDLVAALKQIRGAGELGTRLLAGMYAAAPAHAKD